MGKSDGGVLVYTFGDALGEHTDEWHGDMFYYSSTGIKGNLRVLSDTGVSCKHLELDQWPEKHVYIIGVKDLLPELPDERLDPPADNARITHLS